MLGEVKSGYDVSPKVPATLLRGPQYSSQAMMRVEQYLQLRHPEHPLSSDKAQELESALIDDLRRDLVTKLDGDRPALFSVALIARDLREEALLLMCRKVLVEVIESSRDPRHLRATLCYEENKICAPAREAEEASWAGIDQAHFDEGALPWMPGKDQRVWMDDSASEKCLGCNEPFSAIMNPRHHCRSCGLLMCSKCLQNAFEGATLRELNMLARGPGEASSVASYLLSSIKSNLLGSKNGCVCKRCYDNASASKKASFYIEVFTALAPSYGHLKRLSHVAQDWSRAAAHVVAALRDVQYSLERITPVEAALLRASRLELANHTGFVRYLVSVNWKCPVQRREAEEVIQVVRAQGRARGSTAGPAGHGRSGAGHHISSAPHGASASNGSLARDPPVSSAVGNAGRGGSAGACIAEISAKCSHVLCAPMCTRRPTAAQALELLNVQPPIPVLRNFAVDLLRSVEMRYLEPYLTLLITALALEVDLRSSHLLAFLLDLAVASPMIRYKFLFTVSVLSEDPSQSTCYGGVRDRFMIEIASRLGAAEAEALADSWEFARMLPSAAEDSAILDTLIREDRPVTIPFRPGMEAVSVEDLRIAGGVNKSIKLTVAARPVSERRRPGVFHREEDSSNLSGAPVEPEEEEERTEGKELDGKGEREGASAGSGEEAVSGPAEDCAARSKEKDKEEEEAHGLVQSEEDPEHKSAEVSVRETVGASAAMEPGSAQDTRASPVPSVSRCELPFPSAEVTPLSSPTLNLADDRRLHHEGAFVDLGHPTAPTVNVAGPQDAFSRASLPSSGAQLSASGVSSGAQISRAPTSSGLQASGSGSHLSFACDTLASQGLSESLCSGSAGGASGTRAPVASAASTCPPAASVSPVATVKIAMLAKPEDVRRDEAVMNTLSLVHALLEDCGRPDLASVTYQVLPVTSRSGLIQWVDGTTVRSAVKVYKHINNYTIEVADRRRRLGLPDFAVPVAVEGSLRSLAVTFTMTYLLAIADRHMENICICDETLRIFGIDFGYILGMTAKPIIENGPKLSPLFKDDMTVERLDRLKMEVEQVYMIVRSHLHLFLPLLTNLATAKPGVQNFPVTEDGIRNLLVKIWLPGADEESARLNIRAVFEQSLINVDFNESINAFSFSALFRSLGTGTSAAQ